ncbi:hypothetical protein KAR91_34075 [Candidatus Pacearchaeota archaeon]|nr:hypothetical protein [Candidatus Pacearchaeota archaeon]
MYQVCTCVSGVYGVQKDPACPMHGKQPEFEITVWPLDNDDIYWIMKPIEAGP